MTEPVIKVGEVMRTQLHIVDGLSSARRAIAEMQRLGVNSLVIDRRHAGDEYGLVTAQDIAEKVIAQNRSLRRTSVYQVMTKPAVTVSAAMNVKYAIRLLARLGLSRALVTRDDELAGLVTLRDLVVAYAGVSEPEA